MKRLKKNQKKKIKSNRFMSGLQIIVSNNGSKPEKTANENKTT